MKRPGNIHFEQTPNRKRTAVEVNGNVAELPKKTGRTMANGVDKFQGNWKDHVGIAKISWDALTQDELLKTEGRMDEMVALVQQRYGKSADEAYDEVERFMHNCRWTGN